MQIPTGHTRPELLERALSVGRLPKSVMNDGQRLAGGGRWHGSSRLEQQTQAEANLVPASPAAALGDLSNRGPYPLRLL